jgi:tRNA modification GTPase
MSMADTIVALSTPLGRSGIGVIRLSGPISLSITRQLIQDNNFTPEPNKVTLKLLRDPETNDVLDHALITFFKAPHSFTGEDIIELSCHGSPVLLQNLIRIILRFDIRLAGPGEFTLRALSNGRMNLSQAEAVRDLIDAQTETAVKQAARQLRGELSTYLQPIKDSLLEVIILLESALEFVEDDLPELTISNISSQLCELSTKVDSLASTFRSGRLLREGLKVTLVGRPNVGKSSLFNVLLSSDRAIVTDIPGTTRDSLSETMSIKGVPILLTDTAGVRDSSDIIENIGVERTKRAIVDADLILVVIDSSSSITDEDKDVLNEVSDFTHILVINKCDIATSKHKLFTVDDVSRKVLVSAKTGEGLNELCSAILEPFSERDITNSSLLITDTRHFDLLKRTHIELESSRELLQKGASEEIVLVGLHNALRLLGQITGETTPDEILGRIFSTFCIGK